MRLTDIAPVAIILVLAGIVLGTGGIIMEQMQRNVCVLNTTEIVGSSCNVCCSNNTAPSIAYRVFGNTSSGITTLASWLPTIALVIAAAIIIGIVFGSFMLGRKGE